jgi:hypothetical protein
MGTNDDDCLAGHVQLPLRQALEQTRPAMDALAEAELLPVNLDPLAVVSLVRGALPNLSNLRERIVAELDNFDLSQLERLETYARALLQAQIVYLGLSGAPQELSALSAEASGLRTLLLSDVGALIRRGRLSASCLWGVKRRKGHRNVASDVLSLAAVLRNHWATIANGTAVTEAELERAESLGAELIRLIGRQMHTPEAIAKAASDRNRAYTLTVRTYNELRQAVMFVCRHQADAERVAPSLYRRRGHRKHREAKSEIEPVERANPTPLPQNAEETLPRAASGTGSDAPEYTSVPVGSPGAVPFVR